MTRTQLAVGLAFSATTAAFLMAFYLVLVRVAPRLLDLAPILDHTSEIVGAACLVHLAVYLAKTWSTV